MARIRLLSTEEIKLIAAGEVVESPASIVKELIENAFDAQSTKISLSIEEGGTKLIKVSDDGLGVDQSDLALALLPHATSKLDSFCNTHIENNNCYGFRGEALAAISGVAELILESRTLNSPHGYAISSKEGKITDTVPCGTNYGTTVTIKNLFESIPVRKKYLPSKLTLEKNILYTFQGLALGKPTIEMTFIKEQKIIYSLPERKSFIARATDFLSQPLNRYTEIIYKDEYCSIEGLISYFEYGQYDRSKMYILVNGRLVKQPKLAQVCIKAYQSEQFQKRFPELFIHITVPSDQIDINVHPRKEEVLFLYQKKIESILLKVLIEAFDRRTKELINQKEIISEIKTDQEKRYPTEKQITINADHTTSKTIVIPSVFFNTVEEKSNFTTAQLHHEKDRLYSLEKKEKERYKEPTSYKFSERKEIDYNENKEKNSCQILYVEERKTAKYIGTLDRTYLMFLKEKSVLFIDQHALHEKMLYENFMEKKNKELLTFHELLFEKIYPIEEIEGITLEEHKEFIQEYFFKFSYGVEKKNIVLTSTSHAIKNINIPELIKHICRILITQEHISKKEKLELLWHEIAALYACKNAIKAGDILNEYQINSLMKQLQDYKKIFFCPHGRPSLYEIDIPILEKLFKRNE